MYQAPNPGDNFQNKGWSYLFDNLTDFQANAATWHRTQEDIKTAHQIPFTWIKYAEVCFLKEEYIKKYLNLQQ